MVIAATELRINVQSLFPSQVKAAGPITLVKENGVFTIGLDFSQISPSLVFGTPPSTDQAIARWSGTTATQLENSAVLIDDTGLIYSTSNLRFGAGGASEDWRIDTVGRLISGATASQPSLFGDNPQIQHHAVGGNAQVSFTTWSTGTTGSSFYLVHAKSNTLGDNSVAVANNDTLGYIGFGGTDTSGNQILGVSIQAQAEATWSFGSVPARIMFGTNTAESFRMESNQTLQMMNNNMVAVRGIAGDKSHGILYNSGLDGLEVRGFNGVVIKRGTNGATESARYDSNGRYTAGDLGSSGAQGFQHDGGSLTPFFQFLATSADASVAIARYSNSSTSGSLVFVKSRSTVTSPLVSVNSGDTLGEIAFNAADASGTPAFVNSSFIEGKADAAPGAGFVPGRIVMRVQPGSAASANEWFRLDSAGRVLFGGGNNSNSGQASLSVGGNANQLQSFAIDAPTGGLALLMFSATAAVCSHLDFYRSKSASVGSATVVATNDALGAINFYGAQQTGTFSTQNAAAQILAEVDGTVTSGAGADMPGRLRMFTTPDGSGTLTERFRIDSNGVKTFTNGAFGYAIAGNGDGGTVTQVTSKSTGVTLNTTTGQITMNNAALAADTTVSFTLTDNKISANDALLLNHISGGTVGSYLLEAQTASGSATIVVRNITTGSLSEAIVISFVLIKAVTS